MANKEFDIIMKAISKHLKREKEFAPNPVRMMDVSNAFKIATALFPDHKTEIQNDPLQTGALILCIDCTEEDASMVLTGETEINLFNDMVSKANNFEFYNHNGNIRFAAVFNGALKLIK